jgi:hypothetical protein
MGRTWGQIAYEGYCVTAGNKSLISGAELPLWNELSKPIQNAWEAAARAVLDAPQQGGG